MTINRAFNHSAALLAHPLSIAAVVLMLVNDLLLKPFYASWLTGKLSDAAGLFFAPLAAAALIAWMVPGGKRQISITGVLAYALVGLAFAAVKTIPAANQWVAGAALPVIGPANLALDPTDLLALPALAVSAWLWRRQPARASAFAWRWALLPLAMIVTIADAAAPDPGIACIRIEQNRLEASGGYGQTFTSADGGLTWQAGETGMQFSSDCSSAVEPVILVEQPGSQVQYRITRDQQVERSGDGGQSWTVDYHLAPPTEAEKAYIQRTRSGSPIDEPVPMQALLDPGIGNLVLAMGHDGVLVRTAAGEWKQAPVGPYAPLDLQRGFLAGTSTLLSGEVVLGAAAALLGIAALAASVYRRRWNSILVILGWIGWALIAIVFPPAITASGYFAPIVWIGLLVLSVYAIFCALFVLLRGRETLEGRTGQRWIMLLAVGTAAELVFVLPFLLWVAGLLPNYYFALALGSILMTLVLIAGKRQALPQPAI